MCFLDATYSTLLMAVSMHYANIIASTNLDYWKEISPIILHIATDTRDRNLNMDRTITHSLRVQDVTSKTEGVPHG